MPCMIKLIEVFCINGEPCIGAIDVKKFSTMSTNSSVWWNWIQTDEFATAITLESIELLQATDNAMPIAL